MCRLGVTRTRKSSRARIHARQSELPGQGVACGKRVGAARKLINLEMCRVSRPGGRAFRAGDSGALVDKRAGTCTLKDLPSDGRVASWSAKLRFSDFG